MALCLILDMHETKMPIILDEMHVTYYIYSNLYGTYIQLQQCWIIRLKLYVFTYCYVVDGLLAFLHLFTLRYFINATFNYMKGFRLLFGQVRSDPWIFGGEN